MHRFLSFVLILSFAVFGSLPTTTVRAAPQTKKPYAAAPSHPSKNPPVAIKLQVQSSAKQQAKLQVLVTSKAAVADVKLQFLTMSNVRIVSGVMPDQITLAAGKQQTYDLEITTDSTEPQLVWLMASGADGQTTFTAEGHVYVAVVDGRLRSVPEPDRRYNGQPKAKKPTKKNVASAASTNNSLATKTVTFHGGFAYNDHLTRPIGLSSIPVASQGLTTTATIRPIRFAQVAIEVESYPDHWVSVSPNVYTSATGAFSVTGTFATDGLVPTTGVRVRACTIGPDAANLVSVNADITGSTPHCVASPLRPLDSLPDDVDTAQIVTENTRSGSGPWNIYNVALDAFAFLTNTIGRPTESMRLVWWEGLDAALGPFSLNDHVSFYLFGLAFINGSLIGGDQWNDAVITHELGHWVMEHYSGFPAGYLAIHSDCQNGNMNMQYSEGWANFFMAAVRSNATYAEDREFAAYYIDAKDDNPALSGIGPASRSIPSEIGFSRSLEVPEFQDITRPADENFRRGNFCEWRIAGALWDIYDTNNDGADQLTRSFNDIFTAFSTQIPFASGAAYPQNINHWWYNWANALISRPGQPSLGDETKLLTIFDEHAISTGYRIELGWTDSTADLDAHLWGPADTVRGHFFYEDLGDRRDEPYAALDRDGMTSAMTETISISRPVSGTYHYGVFNWSGQNRDMAVPDDWTASSKVRMFDNSDSGALWVDVAHSYPLPSGAGNWWSVLQFNPLGDILVPNALQGDAPTSYSANAGTGIDKQNVITGTFFVDVNGNNMFDSGEDSPFSYGYVSLMIDGDGDGMPYGASDTRVQLAPTSLDGRYVFVNVPPGTYLINPGDPGTTLPLFLTVTITAGGRVQLPTKGIGWSS